MNYRDFLQKLIYCIINPLVHGMIRVGITPNVITTTGLVLNALAAVLLVCAGLSPDDTGQRLVGWAGGVILFAGLFDMMDGRVARVGNMSTTFGALYDSVLDRYSELLTLFGLCAYFSWNAYLPGFVLTALALIGSLMVSYVRARAEGLGLECKVGLMQRPERVVLTATGAILYGIFASSCAVREVGWLFLTVPMGLIALLANWTAFVRLRHCRKLLRGK